MHRTAGQQALKSGLFCSETSIPCNDQQGATLGCETDSEKDPFHDLKDDKAEAYRTRTSCAAAVSFSLRSYYCFQLLYTVFGPDHLSLDLGRGEPKKPEYKMKCASLFG